MSFPNKLMVFLGRTFSGHNHDYSMLKQEVPPELDWFEDIHVRVDLGYQGMQSDYRGNQIDIPTKKPRKSKKNPNPQLSDEQKAVNKALSQVRIFIEHAIGGMKRYNILVHVFRNRKAGARFSWGRAGIATKMRYAFGTPHQGFQRRPMPDAMPTRQHTRR